MTVRVDLDRVVSDSVHLESLPGVVERLLQQCHDLGAPAMTDIKRVGNSVVCAYHGPLGPLAELRMYSSLSVVLGDFGENQRAGYAPAIEALRRSRDGGVLRALYDVEGPLRYRVDPLRDRWDVRDVVTAGLGWHNDPSDWQVNLSRSDELMVGQVGALYHSSRFPAMRRLPGATNPLLAALLARLLKAQPGNVVYDPFCGSGTLLVEVTALDQDLVVLGSDVSRAALVEAAANQPLFAPGRLLRADAARLPVASDSVDRVLSNLPFGKRVGSHAANVQLYPAFLAELNRVLRTDGRAVLLTEDKNLFRHSVEDARGLRVLREVPLASGGLHPSAYVLERTRAARRAKARPQRPLPTPEAEDT